MVNLAARHQYSCPRKWGYDKRLGLPFVAGPALCLGTAVDEGVTVFFSARIAGRSVDEARAMARATGFEAWTESTAANLPAPLEPQKNSAYWDLVDSSIVLFVEKHRDVIPAAVQFRHEFTVAVGVDRVRTVLGFSDRIDADGTIVDLKCVGSPRWSSDGEWDSSWVDEKRDQLTVYYASRLAEARRGVGVAAPVVPEVRLAVIYARLGMRAPQFRELTLTLTDADVARVVDMIRTADAIVESGVYPARPGEGCRMCSHLIRCRDDFSMHSQPFCAEVGVPA